MAAATTAVLTCCRQGDHIVAGDTLYGGTHQLFTQTLPRLGIEVSLVDTSDPQQVLDALPEHVVKLDPLGTIETVNSAWNRFARETGVIGVQP